MTPKDNWIGSVPQLVQEAKRAEEQTCSPRQNAAMAAAELARANNARLKAICKHLGIDEIDS